MKKLTLLWTVLLSGYGFSQQLPQYSQYLRNQYMVTPGAAGVYDFVDLTIGGRMQWLGFDNAPKTSYIYGSAPLTGTKLSPYNPSIRVSNGPVRNPEVKTGKLKHALGGQFIADQYGAYRHLKFALTYAIHLPVSRNYNLSFGTNLGMSNRLFLSDKAQVMNVITDASYIDPTYDDYIANSSSMNNMDIGAGLYFYSKNMFIGFSADQLTRDLVSFGNQTTNFDPGIHMMGTAGVKFPISENLTLMPAVLVKYINPAPVSIDATLQLEYKEWLWCGVSYRNQDAVVAMAGLNINERFKFGYSFDINTSRINQYSAGGHEVILGLMLGR